MEMGLEDQRKSLKGHIQYESVWMQLDCNIPMQMDLQDLSNVIINVNAMQNLICQVGIVVENGGLACFKVRLTQKK